MSLQLQEFRDEALEAISRVVDSQYFILGPEVAALEKEVATYSQASYAVGVSSGTDALLVALLAIDVQPGDEVISPCFSFFSTASSIARLGARPVFVDIDPRTYNIDMAQAVDAVTPKTKAIIPVHLFGQVVDVEPLEELAGRHGIRVIEDAAQAIGAEYKGRRAGSFGDMGCFSFYPTKNLGAMGDAGMVTVQDVELTERLQILRNHGFKPKYSSKYLGGNFRLDAIQAAVLRVKLKYLDHWHAARQQNAVRYAQLFGEAELTRHNLADDGVVLPFEDADRRHIFHQYVIRVAARHRDPLRQWLSDHAVGTEIYYPVPLHLQPCFADLGHRRGDLPHGEAAAEETIALPIFPELTEEQQARVVQTVAKYFAQAKSA
jgi:dTDP-4-amino-4,6-dideoxygalactose transaminase